MGLVDEEATIYNISTDGLNIEFEVDTDKAVGEIEESEDILSKRLYRLSLSMKHENGNYTKIMDALYGNK